MFSRFRSIVVIGLIAASAALTGCVERIGTGEVGLRVDSYKQIKGSEIMPGDWGQTIIGDILTFQTRDINGTLDNLVPVVKEKVQMADFDMSYIYEVNPNAVSEVWSKVSKSNHAITDKGDVLLMRNYTDLVFRNAVYDVVSLQEALKVNENRTTIEKEIREKAENQIKADGYSGLIKITKVSLRNAVPPASITKSSEDLVRASNLLATKEKEVLIAQKEAERMKALASDGGKSIDYMDAQSRAIIANAIANGKVQTIVLPMDFKGIVNVK